MTLTNHTLIPAKEVKAVEPWVKSSVVNPPAPPQIAPLPLLRNHPACVHQVLRPLPRPLGGRGVADHILIWPASPIWRGGDTTRRSEVKWPGLFTRRWVVQTADACPAFVLTLLMTPLKTTEYFSHYGSTTWVYIYDFKNNLE